MTNKIDHIYLWMTFVFLALFLFYFPCITGKFGYLNDYTTFEYNAQKCCMGFPETIHLFAIGRPIQAFLLNSQLLLVQGIESLQWMRLFFILLICAIASLFFMYTQRILNISRYGAALLSLLVFTLPSMTINSFWIAQSIPGIIPIGTALLAHFLLHTKKTYHRPYLLYMAASILIYISLFIYPPATFFFFTLTFLQFLFGPNQQRSVALSQIFIEIGLALMASLAYFLSIKYLLKPMLIASHFGGMDFQNYFQEIDSGNAAYRIALSFHFQEKIARYFDLMGMMFSAWFPPLTLRFIIPIAMLFTGILIYAAMVNPYLKRMSRTRRIVTGLTISLGIVILSPIPVIIGQGSYPMLYRVTFAPMSMVCATFVFAIDRLFRFMDKGSKKNIMMVIIGLAVLAAVASSYTRLILITKRLNAEYDHVLQAATCADKKGSKQITLPPFESPPDPKHFLYRDFGYTAVNSITLGMVNAALKELGQDSRLYQFNYDPLGPRYVASFSDGIQFTRPGYPEWISRIVGISGREPFGRWTDGEKTIITLNQPLPKQFVLKIKAKAFLSLDNKPVNIIIGSNTFNTRFHQDKETEIALPVISDGRTQSIIFEFPHLPSPKELHMSTDTRHLGLALVSLKMMASE